MAWTIEVDFGTGYENITAHCSDLNKRQRLHKGLKPTINTCSFLLQDITTANKFNVATTDLKLKIQKDAADWFIGLIRPTFQNTIQYTKAEMTIEGYDKGIMLQQKINQNFYWRNYKVCDTVTKAKSILHQLFYKAGIVDGELNLTTIDTTLPFYGVEVRDKRNYKQEITDLLFEFGYTYDVKNSGIFELHDLYPTALGGLTPIDDADMYNILRIAKQEVKYEAIRITWYPTTTITGMKVFSEPDTIKLNKNEWYPEGSSAAVDVPSKFSILELDYKILEIVSGITVPHDIAGWELLAAYNAKLYSTLVRVGLKEFTHIPGAKEAIIKLQAQDTIWTKKIKGFNVFADIIIRKKNEVFSPISPAGYGGEKIRDVSTRFVGDATNAQRLANGMRKYYDFADFEYQFNTLGNYSLCEYLDLTEAVMSISTTLRVVEIREEAQYGRKVVLCEGADDFTVVAVDVERSHSSRLDIPLIQDDIADYGERMDTLVGLDGKAYEHDDPITPEEEIFELSEPDCQGNLGTEPTDKIVHYEPAEYADERGILYRNPHTKMWNGLSEAIFQEGKNLVKSPEALIPPDWTESNVKATLTGQYVNGLQLTKVLATAANGGLQQGIFFTGDGVKSVQETIRKGDDTTSRFFIWDITASVLKFNCTITWSTQNLSCTTGILHGFEWIDSETVLILGITTLITAANSHRMVCRIPTNGKYSYFTGVQAEDLIYPTPYIPLYRYSTRVRPEVNADYRVDMQSMMVFKLKIKPWFAYTTATWRYFLVWRVDGTHEFKLGFSSTSDKIGLLWQDGGTVRYLISEQFDDGTTYDDINSELIICGAIRFDQQSGQRFFIIVDGTKQTEGTSFSGIPDAKASSFPTLSIGHLIKTGHADSLIESVQVWDWDGADLGMIDNEVGFDVAVGGLTERFSWVLEEYEGKYQPLSKRGSIGAFQAIDNECAGDSEDLTGTNWTTLASNCTPTLSDFYIGGHRFTKLLNSAAAAGYVAYAIEASTFTATSCSLSLIAKYGNAAVSGAVLYDNSAPANRIVFTITWATFTVTASTGTLFEAHWISPDTVEILLISAAITVGNVHHLRVYASNAATLNEYTYWTCAFPHDSTYPLPYTPIAREKSILNYTLRMPPVFTLMFWVRTWLPDNLGSYLNVLAEWYVNATHRFIIQWRVAGAVVTINVVWHNGTTERLLTSQQFDDGSAHDDINQSIHVAAKIDLTAGQTGSALWINGIQRDADWGGAPDTYTDDFPIASIGHENELYQADSMISDLLFCPGLVDDSMIKDHYLKNRPWYEPSEIANIERTVKVGPGGIRMHNSALTLTDRFRRQLDISPNAGLLARDASGTIIHDIPDAMVQKGNWYLGHDLWNDDLATYKIYDVIDFPEYTWIGTDVTCLTNENSNVKKGIFKIYLIGEGTTTNNPQLKICLRPKGTSWGNTDTANTPQFEKRHQFTSGSCSIIAASFCLDCPIGDDNKIQFFAYVAPDSIARRLKITQLGLGI